MSITIDEAYTFNEFVSRGFHGIFESYDANNHVLHSALVWISAHLFPLSELTVRLPALLGAALYLWCLLQLVERLFFAGHRWLQTLTYAVLICNPLTLDLLCLARGYSLALGFFAFALLRLVDYLETRQPRHLRWMSIALGLCVAANLSFVFVAIATLCIAVVRLTSWRELKPVLWPAFVTTALLLGLPLSKADRNHFYWGAADLRASLDTTTAPFLQHHPVDPGPLGSQKSLNRFKRRFLPAGLLVLALATLTWLLKGERGPLVLVASIFFVALFGYWLAHVWLGIPYPSERTGVPLVLLFFLCLGGAMSYQIRHRWLAIGWVLPVALLFVGLLVQFAEQVDPHYTWAWQSERDNRQIADLLRQRGVRTLSVHWTLQPALEFYRKAGRIPTLAAPVPFYGGDSTPLTGHDGYVLYKKPVPAALEAAFSNALTGVTVAFPKP